MWFNACERILKYDDGKEILEIKTLRKQKPIPITIDNVLQIEGFDIVRKTIMDIKLNRLSIK